MGKWNDSNTRNLIANCHRDDFIERFNKTVNRPRKRQEYWNSLGATLSPCMTGSETRVKYNQLLCKYRESKIQLRKSGGGAIKWKYWEAFDESYPRKDDDTMKGVEDLGFGDKLQVSENEISTIKDSTIKENILPKSKSYKEIKREALMAFTEGLKEESVSKDRLVKLESRVDILGEKMDTVLYALKNISEEFKRKKE